ncbi:MAG: hypothetical protein LC804_23990 [Acidobacteria bacterium]|nr:hypothetical protein [Acidobacteriota bacterium]
MSIAATGRTATLITAALALVILAAVPLYAQGPPQATPSARRPGGPEAIPSIEDRTNGLKKIDGFFPIYWDEAAGRLWLEVPKLDTEVLYSTGFATGLGSSCAMRTRSRVGCVPDPTDSKPAAAPCTCR